MSQTEINSTIDSRSVSILSTSFASKPMASPYPTLTLYASKTPFPTATHYPTMMAYQTQPPYPTATAFPTWTPYPTWIITTSIPLSTETVSSEAGQEAAIQQPVTDNSEIMLQILIDFRSNLVSFGGLIDESVAADNPSLNCMPLSDMYDSLTQQTTIDVSQDQQNVQNAYGMYVEALSQFHARSIMLVENCRKQLAGESTNGVSSNQWELAREAVDNAISLIEPQIRKLG
ncbi:MAG: hypothetical protein JXA42_25320, partial [Anaerolineales bacterium]|nr:hypothetical protein [Anaerolineales bacterium]